MTVYTFSEARQHLASVLEQARLDGEVRIRRQDGTIYTITPTQPQGSPLDVGYVDVALTRDEVIAAVRESRERGLENR
ncbi:MAG: type II toxin-antitoxin system Phd/YefM family antitoxin [Candidatus Tectomicrobia bacterium]|nr:type II toxin-antitoxin system Phd/YefM family antitoxin [Candidatus Tectomicrobia bacterium]